MRKYQRMMISYLDPIDELFSCFSFIFSFLHFSPLVPSRSHPKEPPFLSSHLFHCSWLISSYRLPYLLRSSFSFLKLQLPPWRGGRIQGYVSHAVEHGSSPPLLQKNQSFSPRGGQLKRGLHKHNL